MADNPANPRVVDVADSKEYSECLRKARDNSKLLVVEFTASWSDECRLMKQTVEDIASSISDADFCTLDTDKFKNLAKRLRVETLPTFLLVRQGRWVMSRVVGPKGAELRSSIEQAIQALKK